MSSITIEIKEVAELSNKLDTLIHLISHKTLPPEYIIFDNKGLQDYLKVSAGKASELRNNGKIAYSKESVTGKIWYKLSDIIEYVDSFRQERF